jgi:hypothetical protein
MDQSEEPEQPGDGPTSRGALVKRPPQVNHGWNSIETAPFDEDIALRVTDRRGGPYMLHWPCRRTAGRLDQLEEGNATGGHAIPYPAVSPTMGLDALFAMRQAEVIVKALEYAGYEIRRRS